MHIAKTEHEKELLWALRGMVIQGCMDTTKGEVGYDDPIPVRSGFITAKAEAIRLLGEYDLVQIEHDNGRSVNGLLHAKPETAKILKTGLYSGTK